VKEWPGGNGWSVGRGFFELVFLGMSTAFVTSIFPTESPGGIRHAAELQACNTCRADSRRAFGALASQRSHLSTAAQECSMNRPRLHFVGFLMTVALLAVAPSATA